MSNSWRRAAACIFVCLCLPTCLHICVFAYNLNQYTQEGRIKAANQLQAAEAASRPCAPNVLSTPQSFQSVQKSTLSTFVSFSPRTRCLLTGDHQSEASPCCLSFILSVLFCLPMRAFKHDLCALGKDRCG